MSGSEEDFIPAEQKVLSIYFLFTSFYLNRPLFWRVTAWFKLSYRDIKDGITIQTDWIEWAKPKD